ncbi:MAG: hypothetical protein K6E20_00945, partial [Acholeplasmatales bacterium]|nr:hypothetical protein [Acholeplasmatales bacterium]
MNKRSIKNIILIVASFLFFLVSFILFCDSKTKKDSSYVAADGKDLYMFKYKFDSNHLMGMIFGIILLVYAIYVFVTEYKNKEVNVYTKPIAFGLISLIALGYNFNNFIDAMVNDDAKFKDVQSSFYGALVFLAFVVYFVFN